MGDEITPDSLLERIAHAPTVQPAHAASLPSHFRVEGVLGEGGFGTVYDVADTRTGARIALKTLHHVAPESLVRFKREFRTLVDLRHPHLVRLLELAGEGRDLYFTMERIEAARPFEAWADGDEDRLRAGLRQIGAGLAALHARGVLHRDLKSSNVLVDAAGRVVLVDFGLAREIDAGGSTQLAGTPLFMAPEQCAQGELGPPVDVYALGVMLFHALSGRYPFEGPAVQVMVAKQAVVPPSLADVAEDAAPDLVALVDAMLARDPASRPTAAMLLERLGAAAPAVRDEEPFVGREAERARLLEVVRARRGVFVRIEGPSGIGKSALMDRLCEDLADEAWVLRGRCHPRESVPYKAFDEVIDQLARRLAKMPDAASLLPRDLNALGALFPVLRATGTSATLSDRGRGLGALRELFGRLGDRRTVLVAIDDLQWGDADSARLLVELLRQPEAPGLTVVATSRDDEAGALMATLATLIDADVELRTETMRLGPLGPADARALAHALAGDARRADTIAAASDGHPLFLSELARGADDADLSALLARRIDAVPRAHAGVLALVAVAGHDVSVELLAAAHGEPAEDAVDALVSARLLRTTLDGTRVYHDRIAETIVERLRPERRQELRRRLAEAMMARDGDPEQIAAHLDAAGDERAADYLERAAARAGRAFAHRNAAELYARALELRRQRGIDRDGAYALELARARSLRAAGRARDAAEAHLAAAALAPADRAPQLRAEAAMLLALGGHVERSVAVFTGVLEEVGVRMPRSPLEAAARAAGERARGWLRARGRRQPPTPAQRARLDALRHASFVLAFTRPLYGAATAAMFVAEAEGVDSPIDQFYAVCVEGMIDATRHGAVARERAVSAVRRAHADIAGLDEPRHAMERKLYEGIIQNLTMHLREASIAFAEAVDIAERHGLAWELGPMASRGMLSSCAYILGDVPMARHLTPRLVVDANERDQLLIWILVAYHHWWVRTVQEGPGVVTARARGEIQARWQARGNELQDWWMRMADLIISMVEGNPGQAYASFSQSFFEGLKQRAFLTRFHVLEGRMMLGRAALAFATVDEARRPKLLREVASVCAELRAEPSAWTLGLAMGLEAGVASLEGTEAEVLGALRATIAAADEAGLVFLAAVARHELAERTGDAELRAAADRFFAQSAIGNVVWGARFMLPGRFAINQTV